MTTKLDEIREHQRLTWNKFSSGWKQWDNFVLNFLRPVGDELIKSVELQENHMVLDVATGTGEPGLTAASFVNNGQVIGIDLSEEMIAVAEENARLRNISNYRTAVCDAGQMPFDNDFFDAVLVRFGFMFFPDITCCAKEIRRVLKKNGKTSVSIWAEPEKNPWASLIIGTVNKMVGIEPPPPDAPGLFRCAKAGFMVEMFSNCGFKNITDKEISGNRDFETPEQYWDFMTSVAAPVVSGLNKADEIMRKKIKETVLEATRIKFSPDGKVSFPWTARIITAGK